MAPKRNYVQFAILALVVGIVWNGCGENGEETADFRAYIQHFAGDDLVAGMEVRVLDNITGDELGISTTSDDEGWVTFNWTDLDPVPEKMGFLVVGIEDKWIDTYQFNIVSYTPEEKLWALDAATYQIAPLGAGVTKEDGTPGLDEGKAVLAGSVYWVDDQDTEKNVACATVELDPPSGQVRYFGDNSLPVDTDTRQDTNPLVAYYLVANIDPGPVVVRAYMDGTEFGSTNLVVFGDAVSISNIYVVEGDPNPQPEGCEDLLNDPVCPCCPHFPDTMSCAL